MSELSNALRQRLAAREDPQVHPDPDSLTAYLEQLLPAAERAQVLQHLALCRQCRDVVALSLPEQPAEDRAAVLTLPQRRSWWAGIVAKPALGLAASLAGLALVATLIIEMPQGSLQKRSAQPEPAFSASSNAQPAGTPAANLPVEPARETAQPGVSSSSDAISTAAPAAVHEAEAAKKRTSSLPVETASRETRGKTADSTVAGPYVNTQMFANVYAYDANAATLAAASELPAAPSPRSQPDHFGNTLRQSGAMLTDAGQLSRADAPYEVPSSKPMRIQTPPAGHFPGLSTMTSLEKTLGRDAKQLFRRPMPPMSAYGVAGSAMFNPATGLGAAPVVAAAPPIAGKDATELEKSNGFTVRALSPAAAATLNIDGTNNLVDGANIADANAKAVSTTWKVSDNKLLKLTSPGNWVVASADQGIDYSVVSSHGADVWAGGSNAALVHSHDSGATWERITLGESATGTITSIAVNGSQVHVKSSSGQAWSSLDGGKIWALAE